MNMKLEELSNYIDINIEEGLARFSNFESFYIKYLKKFVEDETFTKLKQAVLNSNYQEIESYSHALKGVCGTLALKKLYLINSDLCNAIRNKNYDLIEQLFTQDINEYEKTVNYLKLL